MLNSVFSSIMTDGITPASFAICTAVSLLCGLILSLSHMFKNPSSKSFAVTNALLPVIVQVIIMLVNGNLGTGIAVAGAFSLVRFRSAPGSAREILSIFTAMAAGLATGVGYVGIAIIFTLILSLANIAYTLSGFGESAHTERELRITVPEDLNYTDMFEDLFKEHTAYHKLKSVKTTNMGSLYKLTYTLRLKDPKSAKALKCSSLITIDGGNINIDSADDAIHSNSDAEINGGSIIISSGDDGIHADDALLINGGEIKISKSYEGLEGTAVTISGGKIDITASDDGINAAGGNDSSSMGGRPGENTFNSNSAAQINITGGYILVNASGDGVDSNGSVTMSGGVLLVSGPTDSGNGAFDYNSSAAITGGTVTGCDQNGYTASGKVTGGDNSFAVEISSVSTSYGSSGGMGGKPDRESGGKKPFGMG